jgi:TRAP-type C4-dicarboxylate transport system substrate-binding protein
MKFFASKFALTATVLGLLSVGGVSAQTTLTMSSWVGPSHPLTRDVLGGWAAAVEKATNGRVKLQMLPKAPMAAAGTFDGVRDGLVDVSYVTASSPSFAIVGRVARFWWLSRGQLCGL